MFSRRSLLGGFLAALTAAPLVALTQDDAEAQSRHHGPSGRPNRGPPPPRRERRPPARHGHVWGSGHWAWDSRRRTYVWIPGRWIPIRRGHRWRQPRWVSRHGQWVFIPGAWVR